MSPTLFYKIGRNVIRAYARLMLKLDIQSHLQLPAGPVLFAANHPSTTDPIFIHLIAPRPISVMITAKVFSIPGLGAYMRRMQQIAVTPGQGEQVLETARQVLDAGRSVAIFPEGLISPVDGFHTPTLGSSPAGPEDWRPGRSAGDLSRRRELQTHPHHAGRRT